MKLRNVVLLSIFIPPKMYIESLIIFVIACIVQVLGSSTSTKKEHPPEIMEAYYQMEDFGTSVTLNIIEKYLEDKNPNVMKCYERIKNQYENFTGVLSRNISQAATKFGKPFEGKKYERNRKTALDHLKRMANNLIQYPKKMGELIKKNDFNTTAKLVKEFRIRFEYNYVVFTAQMNYIRKQSADTAENAERRMKEIRGKAYIESQKFVKNFENCVGGPKYKPNLPGYPKHYAMAPHSMWVFF